MCVVLCSVGMSQTVQEPDGEGLPTLPILQMRKQRLGEVELGKGVVINKQ